MAQLHRLAHKRCMIPQNHLPYGASRFRSINIAKESTSDGIHLYHKKIFLNQTTIQLIYALFILLAINPYYFQSSLFQFYLTYLKCEEHDTLPLSLSVSLSLSSSLYLITRHQHKYNCNLLYQTLILSHGYMILDLQIDVLKRTFTCKSSTHMQIQKLT